MVKKIAVVEDNPDNRLVVQAFLADTYDLVEYMDGESAARSIPQNVPDAILLDISLPDITGDEVLRRLRADERTRNVPVIALTAHAMAGDRDKYLALGFNDYISKPILDDAVLLDALSRLIS